MHMQMKAWKRTRHRECLLSSPLKRGALVGVSDLVDLLGLAGTDTRLMSAPATCPANDRPFSTIS
eukprot:1624072-Amphidinium_carterae.1